MPESVTTGNQYGYENPQQRATVSFQPFSAVTQATNSLNQIPQATTTYSFVPTPLIGQVSQPANGVKPKRQQVKNACVNCQKACKKCDDGRPCQRCIKYELTDSCKDSIRKERKKGIKRGPYKRKQPTEGGATNTNTASSTPDAVPSTAPVMPPVIPNGGVSMPFSHPIPVNLPLAALQFHSAGAPINVATPEGLGQFLMIPATNGATPYYLLVPSSHYPQQSSAANQKQEASITVNQPQQSSVTSDQKQVSIYSPESHFSQTWQSVTESENSSKEKSQEPKVNEKTDKKVSITSKQDNEKDEEDKDPKDGQGSNLSVLSLVCSEICSEMLDKSHDPSKQKGKISTERLNETPKDKSSPTSSNSGATPNIENAHCSVVNGNNKVFSTEQTLETKESSSTPNVKENKIVRGENNLNRQESKKGTFVSLTEQSASVTPMQTDVESQPPTFAIPPACSPLVFSIPANSYSVAPTQVVPIKREITFSGVSASTDFKRARHSLINDATQGQFQLEQPSFPQQQVSITQQYYVPGVQNGPNYLQSSPNQQSRNPIESYEGQGTLFAGARFIDPRLPSPTSFSYVYNPNMSNNHVLQSEVDGKSFGSQSQDLNFSNTSSSGPAKTSESSIHNKQAFSNFGGN
ncbi:putative fungal zinc cluster transcription factor [Gigaspora margarita]|nr:putative fungal zinc cluster transcription factor [Gigaspora margarita]